MPLSGALEVSRLKVFIATIVLMFSFSSLGKSNKPLCEIPDTYKRYFELKDLYSFKDENLESNNALEAQKRISENNSEISENDLNIIKGNKLQVKLLNSKKRLEKSTIKSYELEVKYLQAKIKYCEFILHTRRVDW